MSNLQGILKESKDLGGGGERKENLPIKLMEAVADDYILHSFFVQKMLSAVFKEKAVSLWGLEYGSTSLAG